MGEQGQKIVCACGHTLGVRVADMVLVKHRGRRIAAAVSSAVIVCEVCDALWSDGLLGADELQAVFDELLRATAGGCS